ncbi:MAG TPA: winged helix-turn-helix domain-containing protein [Steroidobacteraceae bacterium]|nr:winged helix-turn-helix domain-containing protein [Steroidobacteraceae bacterium]
MPYTPVAEAEIYEFGRFRLDVGERRLTCREGAQSGPMPEKAFQTLVHLVRHCGTLVTDDDLLTTVWPGAVVERNNLGKAVHVIRRVLGDTTGEPRFIETIPKHGYRFIADVTRVGVRERSSAGATAVARKTAPARSKAYDLYIRGKVKAGSENTDDNDGAITALEAAVAIDPYFAEAYAQLARAYNTRAFKFSAQSEAKSVRENAEVAVAKALDLNPDLAEAHFARGLILWTQTKGFPHEQAIKAFKRSLELNPQADETHHQLSMVYSHIGLLDQALEHVRTAIDLNPNNTMARFRVGVYMAWQCRFSEALAVLKTVPRETSPMLVDRVRAEVLIQMARLDDARSLVDEYLRRHPRDEGGSFTSLNALLLAKEGETQGTEEAIARSIRLGRDYGHFHHSAYNIGSAWAELQRPDEAVKWLESAADDGFPCYPYFAADPNLEPLRGDPLFAALISSLHRQWLRFTAMA